MITTAPVLPVPWLLLCCAAGLAPAVWRYSTAPDLAPRQRAWLIGLRACTWAVLFVLGLRPANSVVDEAVEKGQLVVLRDRSSSMAVTDGPRGASRTAVLNDVLAELDRATELHKSLDVVAYDFATHVGPAGDEVGADTSIGHALTTALALQRGSRMHAVLLLSDGRNTAGAKPLQAIGPYMQAKIPIHALTIGRARFEDGVSDGIMQDLEAPPVVEAGKPFHVQVRGVLRGAAGEQAELVCLLGERELARTRIAADSADFVIQQPVALPGLQEEGYHRLEVRIEPLAGEISPENNELHVHIRVRDDGVRVLYLDATINPQYKFLKRLIQSDESFALTAPSPFFVRTPPGRKLVRELDLVEYDVIILGAVPADLLRSQQWHVLPNLVRTRGVGLLSIGAMTGSRHVKTLRSLLPTTMSGALLETRRFVPLPASEHFVVSELAALLGSRDFSWQALETTGMRHRTMRARALSTVLFADQRNYPLLIVDSVGQGRVATWTTPVTWSWQLNPAAPEGLYGHVWMRLLYWLASREQDMSHRLALQPSVTHTRVGEDIELSVTALDENNIEMTDLGVEIKVQDLANGEMQTLTAFAENGRYVTSWRSAAGDFSLSASARHQGEEMTSNEFRIAVHSSPAEDADLLADPELMAALAERTGGLAGGADALPEMLKRVPKGAEIVSVRRIESATPLWDRGWTLLLVLIPLSAEWVLRRRLAFK